MTTAEIVKLLILVTTYDQRTTGDSDTEAWYAAVGDLEYEDARQGVIAWYRTQSERIMPAHVRAEVRRIRMDKIGRTPLPAPPSELTDEPGKYKEAIQAGIRRLANSWDIKAGLGDRPPATEPSQEYRDMREWLRTRNGAPEAAMDPQAKARQQVAEYRADRARRGDANPNWAREDDAPPG